MLVQIWSTPTSVFLSSNSSSSLQRLKELVWGEHSLPHFLFSSFLFLFYFILISLIFLLRFSLFFKLIFVLACFSLFCNFSCINFYSLSENFKAGMKIRKAGKRERNFHYRAKILYVANFRYRANFRYVANFRYYSEFSLPSSLFCLLILFGA